MVNIYIVLEWEDILNVTPKTDTIKETTGTFNSKSKNFLCVKNETDIRRKMTHIKDSDQYTLTI